VGGEQRGYDGGKKVRGRKRHLLVDIEELVIKVKGEKGDWQRLIPPRGFRMLPKRWVVERTFSWLSQYRQMSKDYEKLCATGEVFVYAAMSRLMVVAWRAVHLIRQRS
jgi:putative transposase